MPWGCAARHPGGCVSTASSCRRTGSSRAGRPDRPDPRGPAPGPGSGSPWPASTSGSARARGATSSAGRSSGGRVTGRPPSPTCRRSRSGSAGSTPSSVPARIVALDVARRWEAAEPAERSALMPDVALAKLHGHERGRRRRPTRRSGSPAARASWLGRLERAFRDARAGLINPPLEDVAPGRVRADPGRSRARAADPRSLSETAPRSLGYDSLHRRAPADARPLGDRAMAAKVATDSPDVHRRRPASTSTSGAVARGPQPGHRRARRSRPGRAPRPTSTGRSPRRGPPSATGAGRRMALPDRVARS